MRDEQVNDPLLERKVRHIIMWYHHPRRETFVLRVEAHIGHVKRLHNYLLSDSDKHTHHGILRGVDSHYLARVLILLDGILQCGI